MVSLFILIYIINLIHAMTTKDKAFCQFLATEVFALGDYTLKEELKAGPDKDPFSNYVEKYDKNQEVKFEIFEVYDYMSGNKCVIRGRSTYNAKNVWTSALEINFADKSDKSSLQNTIKIIPKKQTEDKKLDVIRYLENVKWNEVIGEDRSSFQNVWKLSDIAQRNRIIKSCYEKNPDTTKQMMQYLHTELQDLTSQPEANNETEQNNPENIVDSKKSNTQSDDTNESSNTLTGNGDLNSSISKDQNNSTGTSLDKQKTVSSNTLAGNGDLDSSTPKDQDNSTVTSLDKHKTVSSNKLEDKSKETKSIEQKSEKDKTNSTGPDKENTAAAEQPIERKDEAESIEEDEKTILANPYFTVPLILTLAILEFFVLLYIRNVYCLNRDEHEEESEDEEESEYYDFV
jgi:hypothetical protein